MRKIIFFTDQNQCAYSLMIVKHQFSNPTDNVNTTIVRVIANITALVPSVLVVRITCIFRIIDVAHHVGH